ncbi:GTPase and tRNA-U34 5-formylation enzyme TrmE [Acidisarcina polymorpha]|uniref:tRNA modification GTPase MnmE n=1 Tax=Acidisarcina polymorpha TaxID=2211140 RepID=A0A2Z5FYE6_9BACT|nr:tRNA uridine-5-carboxymethylaminomethyl(34) synthesis GTPase MnmE [Acidisarcina polymorpha]AXC11396.1 GTPase and tRNA-U34 5-formylation enzyme TrmE [Acidisarcina polymorpha]
MPPKNRRFSKRTSDTVAGPLFCATNSQYPELEIRATTPVILWPSNPATQPIRAYTNQVHSHQDPTATADRRATDTIVAISTPPGRGGIGIVRLSGPDAVAIATPLLRIKNPLAHGQARFAEILDPDQSSYSSEGAKAIDQAIVTFFAASNSYTSEDLVEIAAHGSPVVLDLLLRRALERGARLAEPGEFTQRAFLSGRIDLTQAEAVRDLIDAQTLYQARVAADQLGGSLARRIQPAKAALITLIATIEAGIDFAEDDIDVILNSEILSRIETVRTQLTPVEASFAQGRIIHDGLTLAIVGQPNVGKSSLFNRLVERERAIVTSTPGTTRDLVTERVSLNGIPVNLIDTAGLRESTDEAEALGIQKSREAYAEADIVLIVLDATARIADQERELLAALNGRQIVVVLNKMDLISEALALHSDDEILYRRVIAWGEELSNVSKEELPVLAEELLVKEILALAVPVSAKTGQGITRLRQSILSLAQGSSADGQSGMLTNLRQHQSVAATVASLQAAAQSATQQIPHEMIMLDLYSALRNLDALTGQTTSDDILNQIFSTFCIGK